MNIVFGINEQYTRHVGVCMVSILENQSSDTNIHFHILHSDISLQYQRLLKRLSLNYPCEVYFYDVSHYDTRQFVMTLPHISIETYYRIFIPDVLKHLDKALYMDVDMIVNGSLTELWATDLHDHWAGVVLDPYILNISHLERLKWEWDVPYFNAGMMLLNIKLLRDVKLYQSAIEVLQRYGDAIRYQDQDILNIIFKNHCLWVEPKFNLIMSYYLCENAFNILQKYCPEMADNLEHYKKDPVVIHYTGERKPWHASCTYPKRALYLHYAAIYLSKFDYFIFSGTLHVKIVMIHIGQRLLKIAYRIVRIGRRLEQKIKKLILKALKIFTLLRT